MTIHLGWNYLLIFYRRSTLEVKLIKFNQPHCFEIKELRANPPPWICDLEKSMAAHGNIMQYHGRSIFGLCQTSRVTIDLYRSNKRNSTGTVFTSQSCNECLSILHLDQWRSQDFVAPLFVHLTCPVQSYRRSRIRGCQWRIATTQVKVFENSPWLPGFKNETYDKSSNTPWRHAPRLIQIWKLSNK